MHDYCLRVCPIVNHLDLRPKLSAHLLSALLHLIRGILHQVTNVLQVSLDNYFNIFLALIEHGSSLQLFILLFKEEVKLALFGLHHFIDSLVCLLLQLDPLVWGLLCEYLPHALKLDPLSMCRVILILFTTVVVLTCTITIRSTRFPTLGVICFVLSCCFTAFLAL